MFVYNIRANFIILVYPFFLSYFFVCCPFVLRVVRTTIVQRSEQFYCPRWIAAGIEVDGVFLIPAGSSISGCNVLSSYVSYCVSNAYISDPSLLKIRWRFVFCDEFQHCYYHFSKECGSNNGARSYKTACTPVIGRFKWKNLACLQ